MIWRISRVGKGGAQGCAGSLGVAVGGTVGHDRLNDHAGTGSLGILGELNEAQHCRAEFYIPGYGWIGVDPADVRKAIREENLDNHDPKLTVLKKLLFGFWEMNWVSLNAAQDVRLRGLDGDPLPWLLYPVVETGEWRLDHPDSSRINYSVTASRSEEA